MTQPTQPLVFDHTAIIALFRAPEHSTVFHYWTQADAGKVRLIVPAAAVAEANRMLRASWNAWQAILFPNAHLPDALTVPPLSEHTAVEAGLYGDTAVGHVTYEARAVAGIVVTQAAGAYQESGLPLLLI